MQLIGGPVTEDLYYASPLHFLPLLEGPLLEALQRRFIVLATGTGDWEDIGESWAVGRRPGVQAGPEPRRRLGRRATTTTGRPGGRCSRCTSTSWCRDGRPARRAGPCCRSRDGPRAGRPRGLVAFRSVANPEIEPAEECHRAAALVAALFNDAGPRRRGAAPRARRLDGCRGPDPGPGGGADGPALLPLRRRPRGRPRSLVDPALGADRGGRAVVRARGGRLQGQPRRQPARAAGGGGGLRPLARRGRGAVRGLRGAVERRDRGADPRAARPGAVRCPRARRHGEHRAGRADGHDLAAWHRQRAGDRADHGPAGPLRDVRGSGARRPAGAPDGSGQPARRDGRDHRRRPRPRRHLAGRGARPAAAPRGRRADRGRRPALRPGCRCRRHALGPSGGHGAGHRLPAGLAGDGRCAGPRACRRQPAGAGRGRLRRGSAPPHRAPRAPHPLRRPRRGPSRLARPAVRGPHRRSGTPGACPLHARGLRARHGHHRPGRVDPARHRAGRGGARHRDPARGGRGAGLPHPRPQRERPPRRAAAHGPGRRPCCWRTSAACWRRTEPWRPPRRT